MARGEFNGAVPAPSVEHGYHFHFGNIEKRVNSTKAFDYTNSPTRSVAISSKPPAWSGL